LSSFFEWDVDAPVPFKTEICPKYEVFVDFLFETLKDLEEEAAKYLANENDCEENAEIRKLLLKFKTGTYFKINLN
jgi:hypothetical protein